MTNATNYDVEAEFEHVYGEGDGYRLIGVREDGVVEYYHEGDHKAHGSAAEQYDYSHGTIESFEEPIDDDMTIAEYIEFIDGVEGWADLSEWAGSKVEE